MDSGASQFCRQCPRQRFCTDIVGNVAFKLLYRQPQVPVERRHRIARMITQQDDTAFRIAVDGLKGDKRFVQKWPSLKKYPHFTRRLCKVGHLTPFQPDQSVADISARQSKDASAPAPLSFPLAFAALTMGAIAMGISPVFVRYAEVGPFASAFWRVALALPLLFGWMYFEARRQKQPLSQALKFDRTIVLCGLFFAGDLFFWHLAILNTTIANATLYSCLAPVWVVLFSGAFIGEPVGRGGYVGLGLCLAGAALLMGSSYALAPERLLGDVYGVITSLFFGLYFLAIRTARRSHLAGALTFKSTAITAALLLLVTLISGQEFLPQTIYGFAALLALGIISHCGGQGLLSVALGSLSAAFSSLVIFIEALAAALFGWLFFAEILTLYQAGGGLLILYGLWVARSEA